MSVQATVISVLAEKAFRDPSTVHLNDTLSDLDMDSVTLLEVLFVLEETYDIDISLPVETTPEGAFDDLTVAALCTEVERLRAEHAP